MDCRLGSRYHHLGPDGLVHRRLPSPQGHHRVSRGRLSFNLPLEVFYLTIPLFMVLVFFYFTDRDQQAIDDRSQPADVVVDVRGKQWAWDFNYKQGDVVNEDLHEAGVQAHLTGNDDRQGTASHPVPAGQASPWTCELNSRDVIHSFWVPAFLQKRDMIPGKTNYIRFTPTKEGTYDGKCAELCGEYHSEMLFRVKVVSESEFQAHMDKLRQDGNTGLLGEEYDRNPNLNEIQVRGATWLRTLNPHRESSRLR